MSSILSSSGLVFATAMVVSSTAVFLAFFRQNKTDIRSSQLSDRPTSGLPTKAQILRPCLCSGSHKDRKKKKVQFAENVKKNQNQTNGDIVDEIKKKTTDRKFKNRCRNEFPGIQVRGMPENRVALYNGILRDRSQRMGFSY